ncbi:MAG: MaoC family dehydratase [Synergistaceae bacterium]|jgi:3-hydroxybutyryl-CoA dehydratase|nr:MaoC family dehydratase [Synergistaceae bacterium]
MNIHELKVGDTAATSKTISESDIYMFAGITGDFNPAHLDEISAGKTKFKHRIAHGMLSAGLISAVIGMKLPGPGTIYMGQDLRFLKPIYIGNTITAQCTVTKIILEKNRAELETVCRNEENEVVTTGTALVWVP